MYDEQCGSVLMRYILCVAFAEKNAYLVPAVQRMDSTLHPLNKLGPVLQDPVVQSLIKLILG